MLGNQRIFFELAHCYATHSHNSKHLCGACLGGALSIGRHTFAKSKQL